MRFYPSKPPLSTNEIEGRLLSLAALFMVLYAAALTIAPAVRARSWNVVYAWQHWLGVLLWLVLFAMAHRNHIHKLHERDPYLLPIAALLSGWGLLTIWRVLPSYGLRQSTWLLLSMIIYIAGMRLPTDLRFLRRYKYLWLTGGLLLTGLTLIFGTSPSGSGPHMWLGCCGLYLQPSEPLKLLLIIYLAAYLAGGSGDGRKKIQVPISPLSSSLLFLLAPTLIVITLTLALLFIQRDLGTATIFLIIYAAVVYAASGRKRILVTAGGILILAAIIGYQSFNVVRVRFDAWLNPWLDPSGGSYQIVQSLLSIANGGLFGRGPGLGAPRLVPVAHSDFIYAALVEETGLAGGIVLLLLLAFLAVRGMGIALNAPDNYRRYLAAGLTTYLVAQSVLIIGGNTRLLPLTGVTIPFVSYGGSSLITVFIALLLLAHVSNQEDRLSPPVYRPQPFLHLSALLLLGLAAAAVFTGWWAVFRGPDLLTRTDNPRRSLSDRYVKRGSLLDEENRVLTETVGEPGSLQRQYLYPAMGSVLGYTHPIYGQAGIEAALDPYLRGLQGNPGLLIAWNNLLYGQPPPGRSLRLSFDRTIQQKVDDALQEQAGAAVLLKADSGQILAMASHPTFDPNELDQEWQTIIQSPSAPLLNRATLGLYPPGPALSPLLMARIFDQGSLPDLPQNTFYLHQGVRLECALTPTEWVWKEAITSGCPSTAAALGRRMEASELFNFYSSLGLLNPPRLQIASDSSYDQDVFVDGSGAALGEGLRVNPLQMALAAAVISGGGMRPAPQIVLAVDVENDGWQEIPALDNPEQVLSPAATQKTAQLLAGEQSLLWNTVAVAQNGPGKWVTWYIGGTLPQNNKESLVLAVLLETQNPEQAMQIGQAILEFALENSH